MYRIFCSSTSLPFLHILHLSLFFLTLFLFVSVCLPPTLSLSLSINLSIYFHLIFHSSISSILKNFSFIIPIYFFYLSVFIFFLFSLLLILSFGSYYFFFYLFIFLSFPYRKIVKFYPLTHPSLAKTKNQILLFLANTSKQPEKKYPQRTNFEEKKNPII